MLFKDISIIDENYEVREHMYVGTEGAFIKYVGDKMPTDEFGEVYEGKNRLLLPAFYNLHSHLPMALMRGYGENLPLMTWLQGKIFPFESHLTEDDMYWGCLMGIAESLRYGIGSCSDMYLNENASGRAFVEGGMKANFSNSVVWMDEADYFDLPYYENTLKAIQKYDGYDDGRLHAEFALHAEYTSTERVVRGLAEAVLNNNSSVHVHVAETKSEVDLCRIRHKEKTPVKYLADCGLFDAPTVAAHCVFVNDDDIAILKEHNVTVATCPKSNLKLASGICPATHLINSGLNVAISTDSVASNNNLNMIEEMRFFNLLQKGSTLDPTVITPQQTLYAATRAGAIGQQRMDCGLIKEGFRADITVMNTDTISTLPVHNMLNNLVYSASGNDVVLTMVDGKVLYNNGEFTTLDIEKIEYECEKSRQRILGSIEKTKIQGNEA